MTNEPTHSPRTPLRALRLIFMILLLCVMCAQIALGIFWITKNLGVIPGFGDTTEYLELSETFAPDEYRPILFPMLLRLSRMAAAQMNIPYQTLLYGIQLVVSYFAIFTAVRYFANSAPFHSNLPLELFFTTYIWTLPMILWFNCCVLTDSFALSALIWMLVLLTIYVKDEISNSLIWIGIVVTYLLQALMRSDRTYSACFMIVGCIIMRALHGLFRAIAGKIRRKSIYDEENVRHRPRRPSGPLWTYLFPVIMTVAAVMIVLGVNSVTQTPGSRGRITTNLPFVLLDRVVWPNMANNYEYFPDEIRDVITIEEAREFDSHNNQVMYQMAPLLEERVGKEKASEYYVTMAKVVWEHDRRKVIRDTAGTVAAFLMMPQSETLNRWKLLEANTGWNIKCMTGGDERLTRFMFSYYMYSFCLIFCTGSIICWFILKMYRKAVGRLSCFIGMSVLLALWFGLGDGAIVNDRYALIVLVTWGLGWMLAFMGLFCKESV